MKKIVVICSVLFLGSMSTARCAEITEEQNYKNEFVRGFIIGGMGAVIVDLIKHTVPSATVKSTLQNMGICCDQFTGQTKIVGPLAGLALYDFLQSRKNRQHIVRVFGVLTGVNLVVHLHKLVTHYIKL